jgi:hypothetical protein
MLNRQNAHALSRGVVNVAGIVATGPVVLMHQDPLSIPRRLKSLCISSLCPCTTAAHPKSHLHLSALEGAKYVLDQWDREN